MMSCSHWGMFPDIARVGKLINCFAFPSNWHEEQIKRIEDMGYRIVPGQDIKSELLRPDGMIEVVRD